MKREAIAIVATVLLGACQTSVQREGAGWGAAEGAFRSLEVLTMGPVGVALLPIAVPVGAIIGAIVGSNRARAGSTPSPAVPHTYEPSAGIDPRPAPPGPLVPKDDAVCKVVVQGERWTQEPQHQALVVEAQRRQLTPQCCRAAFG